MRGTVLAAGLALLLILAGAAGALAQGSSTPPHVVAQGRAAGQDVIDQGRGRILLLLLGMPGCPGTEAATKLLCAYAQRKEPDVLIYRIDVPPPGGSLSPVEWSAPFPRIEDDRRLVADRLEFFFYPTFYVLDRDGEVRFTGGCALDDVIRMVAELRAEKPGEPKKHFTPPMPSVGSAAAEFSAPTLDGPATSLGKVRGSAGTLVYFATTECPFSTGGLKTLPGLARDYLGAGISVVVVNKGQRADEIRAFYRENLPGIPVLVDESAAISGGLYGVTAVPFFYLVDGGGKIVLRRPFTEDEARRGLNALAGRENPEKGQERKGGG